MLYPRYGEDLFFQFSAHFTSNILIFQSKFSMCPLIRSFAWTLTDNVFCARFRKRVELEWLDCVPDLLQTFY